MSLNTLLTDGAHDEHIAFWRSALASVTDDFHVRQPWLSMPAAAEASVTEDVPVSAATAKLIEELGRGQDAGVFVVIAGAASYLLHVCTQASTIVIDTPQLANGGHGEELIPIVTTIDRSMTIRDYLARVGEAVSSSYSYQPFPIGQFAEVMLKRTRPSTNVIASLTGFHGAPPVTGHHDLQIVVSRDPGLTIRLTGRAPSFSRAYLQLFARHLARVLESFSDRSVTLDGIDVMGAEERQRLLVTYNAAATATAIRRTIHELFEEQAARGGSNTAVRLHDQALTYETLNQRANQLARFLQNEYGIQRGDVVGVVIERSPFTIAGLLAVLKAGATYLPIDADYPEERLQFMVADASVKALLVHSSNFERLTSLYETPMFALDLQLETLDTDHTNLATASTPDDVAYIIYTSGSTGQPKAVLLEHGAFTTMALHHISTFKVTPEDRLLQFYGLSFDSSLFEVFVSLLSGATLVMIDRDTINDPAKLAEYIDAQGVTTLTLPPVYLSTLDRARLAKVRRYISAGDHCRVEDAVLLANHSDYYNSYGPTETTVCVTHYRVDPKQKYGSRIPIGGPITGTSIYLLDEQLRPVPEGVVGELCVGGTSVARGYLNRPELTAEKFIANPFVAGDRLYRTGDLGAWLPGGNLEVIGRKDNQVKIRGYRVELGEIESVLDQHPMVRESAVIAREDELGNKRLAAYVTGSGAIDVADLKALLRSRLPEFMIPSTFMVLETMPVTANGKIDRKALAGLVETTTPVDPTAGQPETPVQESLVRIWQDVLGVPRVGIHDNLFDLGGDSILIIQIVSRAKDAGLKLAPNQLFDHQTVATLAEVAVSAEPTIETEQGVIEGPAPLAPMQAWFFEQPFADRHHFNQSVTLEVPKDSVDVAALAGATIAVLSHHDALRLRFAEHDGQWAAEYAPVPAESPFAVIDLSSVAPDQLDGRIRSATLECQSRFDLSTGPLFRVVLLQLPAGHSSRLLFVAHHLVVDGVSWRILLSDFATAYAQVSRGDAVSLPAKTTSYRAWTAQVAERAQELDSRFWVDSSATVTPIPTDRAKSAGANIVGSAVDVTRSLDRDLTTALLQEVPRAYSTEINDVLLAGLAMTIQAWTGQGAVMIDLEGHGRDELTDAADTSRTVGWFTAQFPVTLRVEPTAEIGDVIKSVKEQLRAIPDRGASYGALRYLSTDRNTVERLKQHHAPEILFNYFGQAGRVLTTDLPWTLSAGPAIGDVSARNARPHAIEINAMIAGGSLTVTWTFSDSVHDRRTIDNLASRYEDSLRRLVDHCRSATARQYTPSDFPAAGLDQKSLDALVAKLNR